MIGVFSFTVSASTAMISLEFVPRTPKGTIFYLDISSDEVIGAAVFEMDFDDDTVEYRSVSGYDGASVQVTKDDDHLRIAYGHPSGGSGNLLRLTFNALTSAQTDFTLHTEQAVDGEAVYLDDLPDYNLCADVGRQTVVSSGAASSRAKKSDSIAETAPEATYSVKTAGYIPAGEEDTVTVYGENGIQGLPNRDGGRWFAIGACAAVMLILLLAAAFLIGRRFARRRKPSENPSEDMEDREKNSDLE
jgi:hypothetical protein